MGCGVVVEWVSVGRSYFMKMCWRNAKTKTPWLHNDCSTIHTPQKARDRLPGVRNTLC